MSTKSLLTRLEMAQPVIRQRDMYYRGQQPARYSSDKIDPKIGVFRSNLSKVAVNAVAERIRLEDVTAEVDGRDVTERARQLIRDADFPMLLQSIVVDMLAVGSAYLIAWVDEFGRPVITGESAEQVTVERDPITRGVTEAVKRWEVTDAQGVIVDEHVVVYRPDKIDHLARGENDAKLRFVKSTPNPLGVVPVIPLVNVERINDDVGASVIDDLAPLVNAVDKLITDMLVTSDAVAKPKRWATGITLEDDDGDAGFIADGFTADGQDPEVEVLDEGPGVRAPLSDADDLWISESPDARFGTLAGADLSGYKTAVDLVLQQISAVTSLPSHMLGVTSSNPATAEALRASEVALADNAAGRVRVVNRPVEWATRLLVAIDQGVKPDRVSVSVKWADTSTRSVAQAADAAVKLHSQGIVNDEEARAAVGAGEEL